jgi:serine/threonine protein kinase
VHAGDGAPWLAMELLLGEPLSAAMARDRRRTAEAAERIARAIAEALEAAHAAGVVHRDLKAANVFLAGEGRVPKLVDFGLASVRGEPGLTATGEVLGTPSTMAPEQIEGAPSSPAVDHYALGCVVYEMLSGRPPFVGSAARVLDQHVHEPPPPLVAVAGVTPRASLVRATMLLLSKMPEARRAGLELVLEG